MTVGELIAELQKLDKDPPVVLALGDILYNLDEKEIRSHLDKLNGDAKAFSILWRMVKAKNMYGKSR